jgi:hypothetical protein
MIIPLAITSLPPASVNTGNWAGYEWHGGVTSAAEFVVPSFPYKDMSPAEKNNHSVLSIWAGLGVSPSIAQIGVYDYVQSRQVDWAGFCAFWPKSDASCGHGISTGDEMFVKVERSGFTYTMTMRDAGPHNVWSISIKGTLPQKNTTAEAIAEDSTYPGYPQTNLTYFSPMKVATSPDPTTEIYDSSAYAVKNSRTSITIRHR